MSNTSPRLCTVGYCNEVHSARGFCRTHYRRIIRGEKPRPQAKARMRADPQDPRHGTRNGYGNCGCRCERCTEANAEAMREYLNADPERRRKWNERQLDRLRKMREQA